MSKEIQIKDYKERIYKAKMEIDFCEDEIDKLNGLTETCQHCEGEGRIMRCHRTFGSHSYTNCYVCRGKGKITKEKLKSFNENKEE